jgi:hypothetical protein
MFAAIDFLSAAPGRRLILAVLPASHHIRLPDLRMQLGYDVDVASETEIAQLVPRLRLWRRPPKLAIAMRWMLWSMIASRSSRTEYLSPELSLLFQFSDGTGIL